MISRYIVFDTETPNFRNDRMSAIGVSVVEGGMITQEFATLINPETYFNAFNIRLTGITPEAAACAPTFPELWRQLQPLFDSGMPVAHNASFDMRVLCKCLEAYGLSWHSHARYLCTARFARAVLPEMPNYKLDTLCDALHIPLEHHRAGSDAHAAAELLLKCLSAGNPEPHIRTANMTRSEINR